MSQTELNTSINVAWDFAGPVNTVPKSLVFVLQDFTAKIIVSGPELDAPPIARVLNMICNILWFYVFESDAYIKNVNDIFFREITDFYK